jgi:hypothetical protein
MPSLTLSPGSLADHPLLAHIPMWAAESEEFKSLRESLRNDGQLYEVLVDPEHRVVDGRNRRNALAALGRDVACRQVEAHEVSTIIFRTLMQRRHLCKGARAFLAVPLVQPLIDAARERKINSLRQNTATVVHSVDDGAPTIALIARDVGVCRATLDYARAAHLALAKAPEAIRADITARVLSGALDVEQVQKSISNYREQPLKTSRLGLRREHGRLFLAAVDKIALHWDQGTEEQRAEIHEKLDTHMACAPLGLVEELHRATAKALKRRQEGGA